jgi:hypothetical protein
LADSNDSAASPFTDHMIPSLVRTTENADTDRQLRKITAASKPSPQNPSNSKGFGLAGRILCVCSLVVYSSTESAWKIVISQPEPSRLKQLHARETAC